MTDTNFNLVAEESGTIFQEEPEDSSPQDLHARNMKAFAEFDPAVYEHLSNYQVQSELVYTDAGDPDVELQGERLYGGEGAYAFGRKQLDEFWRQPQQISMGLLDSNSLDKHANRFAASLVTKSIEQGVIFRKAPVSVRTYFAIVFGIGLGPHIDEIVEKTSCRHLILVEPNPEFLYHSTFIYDWAGLYERLGEKRKVTIIISSHPSQVTQGIQGLIRSRNPSGMDGLVHYKHYNNSIFTKSLSDLLGGQLSTGMMGLGFFEDELHMITQSHENLRGGKVRVLANAKERAKLPVFIIGNGPSLDTLIPVIKENKDKAIIIACGSALDPLMENGIVPDFVALLERAADLLTFYKMTAEVYDLSKTCLVGASNLYPGVTDLFGSSIIFFRTGISSRPLFARREDQCPMRPDPLVANAALAFANSAGVREFYFLGVDVGAKEADYHHSKSSWYSTKGMKYDFKFDKTVPGNFGGTVLTTQVLEWSRNSLELAIRAQGSGKRYYNCSDGALIEGTLPKHPSTLSLPEVENKKEIVDKLRESFPIYTEDDLEEAWEEADIINRLGEVGEQLAACLNESKFVEMDFMTDMMEYLKPASIDDSVAMVYRGSIYFMLMVIYSYSRRIETDKDQEIFQEIACQAFGENIGFLRDEAIKWFQASYDGKIDWSLDEDGKPVIGLD